MAKVPRFDNGPEIKFITNYFVQGCVPPYNLFVEFSEEPTKDLWVLMLGIDPIDIGKDWLRPKRGRPRTPKRHGRKRPWRNIELDPNAYVGNKLRAKAPYYPGLDLPGARALFKLGDALDRLNFTAAVVEGLQDVGFETLWGILSAHPEHCPNMAFLNRHETGPKAWPGVVGSSTPIGVATLDSAQHFGTGSADVYTTFYAPWTLVYNCRVEAYSSGGAKDWELIVRSDKRGVIEASGKKTFDEGEEVGFEITAEAEPGEYLSICRRVDQGSVYIWQAQLFCFAGTWL